ncbi:MAG: hypothetical protein AB1486_00975 [Planctomycetota bacterium]
MTTATLQSLRLKVTDFSRQQEADISEVPADSTVGEFIDGLLPQMNLPQQDYEGRPLSWGARLEREGRRLHASERLVDAVQDRDELMLLPDVEAGRP